MDEQTIEQSGGVGTSAAGPSQDEAEQAVRTLIKWAGDDPEREGLRETPSRVARAYKEWFAGYEQSPEEFLQRTFEEVAGYDEIVLLRDVQFVERHPHRAEDKVLLPRVRDIRHAFAGDLDGQPGPGDARLDLVVQPERQPERVKSWSQVRAGGGHPHPHRPLSPLH